MNLKRVVSKKRKLYAYQMRASLSSTHCLLILYLSTTLAKRAAAESHLTCTFGNPFVKVAIFLPRKVLA